MPMPDAPGWPRMSFQGLVRVWGKRRQAKNAPRSRSGRNEGHMLAVHQTPQHLQSATFVDTDTDERRAIVHRPEPRLAVAFYPHGVYSSRAVGAERVPCPVAATRR